MTPVIIPASENLYKLTNDSSRKNLPGVIPEEAKRALKKLLHTGGGLIHELVLKLIKKLTG
jgi:hypothetical protein